eukprot:scaffold78748_cov17-Prasinocladus_malaysianus.AAC.2
MAQGRPCLPDLMDASKNGFGLAKQVSTLHFSTSPAGLISLLQGKAKVRDITETAAAATQQR